MDPESRLPQFKPMACCFLLLILWASDLTSMCLSFPIIPQHEGSSYIPPGAWWGKTESVKHLEQCLLNGKCRLILYDYYEDNSLLKWVYYTMVFVSFYQYFRRQWFLTEVNVTGRLYRNMQKRIFNWWENFRCYCAQVCDGQVGTFWFYHLLFALSIPHRGQPRWTHYMAKTHRNKMRSYYDASNNMKPWKAPFFKIYFLCCSFASRDIDVACGEKMVDFEIILRDSTSHAHFIRQENESWSGTFSSRKNGNWHICARYIRE